MKRERKIWVGIVTFLLLIILINFNLQHSKADENQEKLFKSIFEKVYFNIKSSYIEKTEADKLLKGAIKGMIKTLDDPHTAFLEVEQKKNLEIETKGQYGGLGIVIGVRNNKLTVISPMEDTPAEKIGILAGDKIVKIEGEPVKDPELNEIVKQLRGKPGTKVTISIEREDMDELIDYTITRENIKIESVKYDKIEDIGYIRLITFSQTAPAELKKVLIKFQEEKIKGLIFDLRNNSGGLLDVAIRITDYDLDDGLIVYTKPRDDATHLSSTLNRKYNATGYSTLIGDTPMVVLVNHGTASASEILSGAIRDNKRGILIGTKTFGKGSVQSIINFTKDYAMRYTTAYYYTPNGTKIHKIGIEPDIEVKFPKITKDERKEIKRIQDEKIIENYLKDREEPDEKDMENYLKELAKKIKLNNRLTKKLIKDELYKKKKKPVCDFDFDVQLKMALQILQSEIAVILHRDKK